MGDVGDVTFNEVLENCKRFPCYSEMENGRHRVFKPAKHTVDPESLSDKLELVFDSFKGSLRPNAAMTIGRKNVQASSCIYHC